MSNTYGSVLIESSTTDEVIGALQKEFKMDFSPLGECTALGMLFQVWETPEEILNYEPEKWIKEIDDNDKFYREFDVSTFNINVDISHPSLSMLHYIHIIPEIIASGISLRTNKRTVAMINNLGITIPLSVFENGSEVKSFPYYYCDFIGKKKWIRKECT